MLPTRTLVGAVIASAVACVAAVAGSPAPASAASCNYTQTSQLFAPWQDSAAYTPFKGGSFESGAQGWSQGAGARIVSGDSNPLLSPTGTRSIEVPGGGTALSPWVCVNSATPSMRLFLRRVSGTGSLTITGVVSSGGRTVTAVTRISGTGTWQPSPVVVFPASMTASDTGVNVQFQFTADSGTVFHVDDVELDPYLRR